MSVGVCLAVGVAVGAGEVGAPVGQVVCGGGWDRARRGVVQVQVRNVGAAGSAGEAGGEKRGAVACVGSSSSRRGNTQMMLLLLLLLLLLRVMVVIKVSRIVVVGVSV